METRELKLGDWIKIDWIAYDLYVVDNNDRFITLTCPKWNAGDSMKIEHWRFNFKGGKCWKFLGKSKPNPFYNKITKKLGLAHPVRLMKH